MSLTHAEPQTPIQPRRSRQKRSAEQWAELISRYHASLLTQHDFCTQNDIAHSSFAYRLKKTRNNDTSPDTPLGAAPLFVGIEPETEKSTVSAHWDVELALPNGAILRLRQR